MNELFIFTVIAARHNIRYKQLHHRKGVASINPESEKYS